MPAARQLLRIAVSALMRLDRLEAWLSWHLILDQYAILCELKCNKESYATCHAYCSHKQV